MLNMAGAHALSRYLGLSAVFGFLFGIRYTLDVWVLAAIDQGAQAKVALLAIAFVLMFAGELLAGTFESARERGIPVALVAFAIWGCLAGSALRLHSASLLLLATVAFGLASGLFHTVVDGWFAGALDEAGRGDETPRRLTQGWLIYNCGYVAGAGAAFPLLFAGNFGGEPGALFQTGRATVAPYVLGSALALVGAVLLVPRARAKNTSGSVSSRFLNAIVRLPGEYRLILQKGGLQLAAAVFAGAGVSLMIQCVDHSAPKLISATSVGKQAVAMVVMNGLVCLGALGLERYLAFLSRRGSETWDSRRTFMICALSSVSVCFTFLIYISLPGDASAGAWLGHAILLGIAQAMLVAVPPLAKAWTLLFAGKSHKNVAIAVLGASKRIVGLSAMLLAMAVGGLAPEWTNKHGREAVYVVLLTLATSTTLVVVRSGPTDESAKTN